MEFKYCRYTGAYVCMRPDVKPATGFEYDEMCFVYVDDILCIINNPSGPMDKLGKVYELKKVSVKESDRHLGVNTFRNEF